MENVDGFAARARRGELAVGTVDTWMLWNLTGGRSHLTDHTQASRTALLNLAELGWDAALLAACGIPAEILPPAVASDSHFGEVDPRLLGGDAGPGIPVTGHPRRPAGRPVRAGVLRARRREEHVRHGRGARRQRRRQAGPDGGPHLQRRLDGAAAPPCSRPRAWCSPAARPSSGCATASACSGRTTTSRRWPAACPTTAGVYLVPAFAGLCAPHWDRDARAAIVGLSLASGAGHVVRAGLEAMAYQTRDNVDTLVRGGVPVPELRVDGGATRNALLCQFQADILGVPVRAAERARTHRARRRLPGGLGRRALARARRRRGVVDRRPGLRTGDVRGPPRRALRRVVRRRATRPRRRRRDNHPPLQTKGRRE